MDVKTALHEDHIERSRGESLSTKRSPPDAKLDRQNAPFKAQKSKGGRKPVHATAEKRQQTNRQAQFAFRERRAEYTKQLEEAVKLQKEKLQNIQEAYRSMEEECVMLRYINSLLECFMLEKGLNIQSELSGEPPLQSKLSISSQPARVVNPDQVESIASEMVSKPGRIGASRCTNLSSQSPQQRKSSQPPLEQDVNLCKTTRTLNTNMQPTELAVRSEQEGSEKNNVTGTKSNQWRPSYPTHMEQLEQEYALYADTTHNEDTTHDEDSPDIFTGLAPYPFHEQLDDGGQIFGLTEISPKKDGKSGRSDPNEAMLNADSFRFTTSIHRSPGLQSPQPQFHF